MTPYASLPLNTFPPCNTQLPAHAIALQAKLFKRLSEAGAINIAEFMALVTGDKDHGYYAAAQPFGRDGDFVTSPEISQLFGEILAIWVIVTWQALGCPKTFILAEGGPGRGTLSDDILRSLGKIAPQCFAAARLLLLETSAALRRRQKQALQRHGKSPVWVEDCAALAAYRQQDIPHAPLIFIANELLDALPICQYQKSAQGWHERLIAANPKQADNAPASLRFILGEPQSLPACCSQDATYLRQCAAAEDGTITETSPARLNFVQSLSRLLHDSRGAALLIDYGSLRHGFGDTLQAVAKHRFSPVLENIGLSDISSHVDFAALAAQAEAEHCHTAAASQGAFLLQMGLGERAMRLAADKPAEQQQKIYSEAERLTAASAMGELFKILCIADRKTHMPPFSW